MEKCVCNAHWNVRQVGMCRCHRYSNWNVLPICIHLSIYKIVYGTYVSKQWYENALVVLCEFKRPNRDTRKKFSPKMLNSFPSIGFIIWVWNGEQCEHHDGSRAFKMHSAFQGMLKCCDDLKIFHFWFFKSIRLPLLPTLPKHRISLEHWRTGCVWWRVRSPVAAVAVVCNFFSLSVFPLFGSVAHVPFHVPCSRMRNALALHTMRWRQATKTETATVDMPYGTI